jgi:hypothetical protein
MAVEPGHGADDARGSWRKTVDRVFVELRPVGSRSSPSRGVEHRHVFARPKLVTGSATADGEKTQP